MHNLKHQFNVMCDDLSENLDIFIENLGDLQSLREQWQSLEKKTDAPFFLSWHWVNNWLALKPSLKNMRKVAAYDNGLLIALSIFSQQDVTRHYFFKSSIWYLHEYGLSGLNMVIEHNGILVATGYANSAPQQILKKILQVSNEWDELQINAICENNPLVDRKNIEDLGLNYEITAASYSRYVDLEKLRMEGVDYLATLSRNTRYQIRRSLKKYSKTGAVSISVASGADESLEYFDGLKEFHQDYWEKKGHTGSFSNPNWVAFHRNIIMQAADQGGVQLIKITTGERIIGYLYNFIKDGHVYMIQSGFNYENDTSLHPGYVSHYLAIEYNLKAGHGAYDFLAGDARYKRSLSNGRIRLLWVKLQRRRFLFRIEKLLKSAAVWLLQKDRSVEF